MLGIKFILSVIGTILTLVFVTPLVSPLWKQIIFVAFALYTIPLMNFRNEFRSMVYNTESWTINIKPVFAKELKTLISNKDLDEDEIKVANKYRVYLIIYTLILIVLLIG